MKTIEIGAVGTAAADSTEKTTAKTVGSGSLEVFATPMMAALMEQAACDCLAPYLEEGETTVGTLLNIQHLAATPCGMKVSAQAVLTGAEGRKLCFEVTARDEAGEIGSGTHERFVVKADRFMQKAEEKRTQSAK